MLTKTVWFPKKIGDYFVGELLVKLNHILQFFTIFKNSDCFIRVP